MIEHNGHFWEIYAPLQYIKGGAKCIECGFEISYYLPSGLKLEQEFASFFYKSCDLYQEAALAEIKKIKINCSEYKLRGLLG